MLVRAGQKSSDRTEPVPPERESLTPEERPKAYSGNFLNRLKKGTIAGRTRRLADNDSDNVSAYRIGSDGALTPAAVE